MSDRKLYFSNSTKKFLFANRSNRQKLGINTGKRVCIPRYLSVNRELTVRCQYTEFQTQSVKINMEEKERETSMSTSFLKREPKAYSTLPIHRISNAISENKQGGETKENVHVYLVTEFQTQSVKINM